MTTATKEVTQAPGVAKVTLKKIPLTDIVIGKMNPRKEFQKEEEEELYTSILENGLINPILVRPIDGGKYELVCGNRRYNASKRIAGMFENRQDIACNVMELTDTEALEMAIVENLQRKDIHPMEEANAFRKLIDISKFTVTEIAARVGKSPNYVARRVKLTDLLKEFQDAFRQDKVSLEDVERLFKVSPPDQKSLWKIKGKGDHIEISGYDLRRYQGNLLDAPFDTKDPNLKKDIGACTTCPHNTASNTVLFPETSHSASCMNMQCFKQKCDINYTQGLKAAKEQPEMVLVSMSDTWRSQMSDQAQALVKKGLKVLWNGNDCDVVEKPDAPDPENFCVPDDFHEQKDADAAMASDLYDYRKQLAEYEKKCASGKFLKAFVVDGNHAGSTVYLSMRKGKSGVRSDEVKKKATAGTLKAEDVKQLASGIKERMTRARELDWEKIQPLVYENLKKSKALVGNDKPMKDDELRALVVLFTEYGGYSCSDKIRKLAGASGQSDIALWNALYKTSTAKLMKIIAEATRVLILDKLNVNVSRGGADRQSTCAALMAVAKAYDPNGVKKIIDEQMQIRNAREARGEERILQLKEKVKEKK